MHCRDAEYAEERLFKVKETSRAKEEKGNA
jgi:hypothetical protein